MYQAVCGHRIGCNLPKATRSRRLHFGSVKCTPVHGGPLDEVTGESYFWVWPKRSCSISTAC